MQAGTKLTAYFDSYSSYHQDWLNRLSHHVGVPLVVYAVLNVVYHIGSLNVFGLSLDLAMILAATVIVFYLSLDVRLGVAAALLAVPFYLAAAYTSWPAGLVALSVGALLLILGHRREGNQPAFLTNSMHLLIGPLWIVGDAMHRCGLWQPHQ